MASIHLECASMMIKIIFPSTGPAQSICKRAHGRVGQLYGCKGATGGEDWCCWHREQWRTAFSRSAELPGYQTYILAKLFMRDAPGCPSCNSAASRQDWETTTRTPHKRQPSSSKSSNLLSKKGRSVSSGQTFGHPCWTNWTTRASCGSRVVCVRIWKAVTGDSDKCSVSNTSSGGVFEIAGSTGNESRLKASALAWPVVFRNWMVYSNIERYKDQRRILADACWEVGLCSCRRLSNGLWSVINVKGCPRRHG